MKRRPFAVQRYSVWAKSLPKFVHIEDEPLIRSVEAEVTEPVDTLVGHQIESLAKRHFRFTIDPKLYEDDLSRVIGQLDFDDADPIDNKIERFLKERSYTSLFDAMQDQLLRGDGQGEWILFKA